MQLFTYPQYSEWFSPFFVSILRSTLLLNRNKHIGEEFLFLISLHFPHYFYWPLTTAASAAACVLCDFTYKLSICTDIIIEIQIKKLLAKLLTDSHWH